MSALSAFTRDDAAGSPSSSTPCDGSGIEKGADDVFVKCAGLLPEKKDDPICNENEDDPDCVHFRERR